MQSENVYIRARKVLQELAPLLQGCEVEIGLLQTSSDHTIHGPPNLVEEVLIALPDDGKNPLQPRCCLKCPLLNDESHE